jgi:putative isomerase
MLVDPTIPLADAWNTWSERPAEMVFLPLGVRVTPVLYAASLGTATSPKMMKGLRPGRHGLQGEAIDFDLEHGGTRLAFAYAKPDPWTITGSWRDLHRAEWGLRFWVTLCLSAETGETVHYREADRAAVITIGSRCLALVAGEAPVQVTGHASVEALVADYDANGYFDIASRATAAPVIALRFNLEMHPSGAFAAAVADAPELAIARAKAALAQAGAPPPALATQTGRHAGALDAVRDVMGWNTLYDRRNHRRTTAISRIWNLGDFAVWFNDQSYAALMTGLFDAGLGRDNLAVAMASATPQGNFACLLTSRDAWVDRTQTPNGAFVVWSMYLRSRDRSLLDLAFPSLADNQRWWRANRDPDGRGLVSCGTSDVGTSLYKGTHFGARNETGMDNSPTHDEAVYDPATRTLSTLDVGLNASLALDAEMLALIAAELGHAEEATEFAALAADTREKIRTELWDEARGLFANRQRGGGFVRSVGPTSFYPLYCGAATPEQAQRLLAHLADPATFGGAFVLPNVTREDPAFADNVYWRGRIWANVNFFVWQGLRRYGFDAEASALAEKSLALFEASWRDKRRCGENYSALTGEITDWPDNDPFYSWGAMLPLLGVAEVMEIGPWNGWEIAHSGEPVRLGPINSPIGKVTVEAAGGELTLLSGGAPLFATNFLGRLTHLAIEPGLFSVQLRGAPAGGAWLRLTDDPGRTVVLARIGERVVVPDRRDGWLVIDLAEAGDGDRLDMHFAATA